MLDGSAGVSPRIGVDGKTAFGARNQARFIRIAKAQYHSAFVSATTQERRKRISSFTMAGMPLRPAIDLRFGFAAIRYWKCTTLWQARAHKHAFLHGFDHGGTTRER